MTKRLCVCLTEKTTSKCLELVTTTDADLIEHRLDFMSSIEGLNEIYASTDIPIIATCRPRMQGGHFDGGESQRIEHLLAAIEAGASYVDLEFETKNQHFSIVTDAVSKGQCQFIVSKHFSQNTPSVSELVELIDSMSKKGANIAKVVVTPESIADCIRVFQLYGLEDNETPLITFGMGDRWKFTRVAALLLGAPFMYVSQDKGQLAAPGQVSLSEMRRILEVLS